MRIVRSIQENVRDDTPCFSFNVYPVRRIPVKAARSNAGSRLASLDREMQASQKGLPASKKQFSLVYS
jgi:hypothetical protein